MSVNRRILREYRKDFQKARRRGTLGLDAPDRALAGRLDRLCNVTLGDFASIVRRHRFNPICSAAEMTDALEEECSLKEDAGRPIGFH